MSEAPEKIWLIDYDGPEPTWCGEPITGDEGFPPIEYVRADTAEARGHARSDAERAALVAALEPFVSEINRLEREYGFDRPQWQYQPLMICLSDILALRAALAPVAEPGDGG